eukprot:3105612-Pyramimonas_sp.AAC.1
MEASAKALEVYWSGVFRRPEVRSDLWPHVEPHIQRLDCPLEINWQTPYSIWYDTLLHRPNSMPGPDGIPYSTWRNESAA